MILSCVVVVVFPSFKSNSVTEVERFLFMFWYRNEPESHHAIDTTIVITPANSADLLHEWDEFFYDEDLWAWLDERLALLMWVIANMVSVESFNYRAIILINQF